VGSYRSKRGNVLEPERSEPQASGAGSHRSKRGNVLEPAHGYFIPVRSSLRSQSRRARSGSRACAAGVRSRHFA
jgi:hypothetical protein